MHKKLIEIMERKPNKLGIHGTGNCYETKDYYERQVDEWKACGFHWLKLLAASDSQVNTVRMLRQKMPELTPIIRFWYGERSYPGARISPDLVKPYVDEGVVIFDVINEPYNEWAGNMGSQWPDQLAAQWASMADAVLKAGGVPCLPSIEGWKYQDIFVPLWPVLMTKYRDLVEPSVLAGHWRTLNHNVDYKQDAGGYLGWTFFDELVQASLGHPLPIIGTEAGPEPGWNQDSRYPTVTVDSHAEMVKQIIQWKTPDYYLADCFWLWEGSGAWKDASWKKNGKNNNKDLPIISWLKVQVPPPPVDLTENTIRVIGKTHPSQISLNPGAALYKAAQAASLGWAESSEWSELGYIWQKFQYGVVVCKDGDWGNVRVVRW